MTVITSQKESNETTKVPATKILDASSVPLGPDHLYQHPPPFNIQDYMEQRRHNRAWLSRCIIHWCGKAIIAFSIAVMLFALIILLLSWAEGYPSQMDRRHYDDLKGSRIANLERMDNNGDIPEPSHHIPVLDINPFNRFPVRRNFTDSESEEDEPGFYTFENALRAMRARFQNVFKHMRDMMGSTDSLPAPSPHNNDTEVVRRITIDGQDFVQTRQVLKKQLPDGEGVIVVVRQQLIPAADFYGNGTSTTTVLPRDSEDPAVETTTADSNSIEDNDP